MPLRQGIIEVKRITEGQESGAFAAHFNEAEWKVILRIQNLVAKSITLDLRHPRWVNLQVVRKQGGIPVHTEKAKMEKKMQL